MRAIARDRHVEPLTVYRTGTVRDGLIEYLDIMQRTGLDAWRHAQLCDFASGRIQFKTAPEMPSILSDIKATG